MRAEAEIIENRKLSGGIKRRVASRGGWVEGRASKGGRRAGGAEGGNRP